MEDGKNMIGCEDVLAARERIREKIYLSPCAYSETLSEVTGNRVFFKLENLQMTGSFKERGALNRLLTLSEDEARRGVIAASAGNHGMAVAFHSQRLGIPATIVMPVHAPLVKVTWVQRYGAVTRLHGSDYDAAFEEAGRICRAEGLFFIHSFNDPWVIAGQGTLGLELREQAPDLDAVILPVGGGGLIAGVALALKEWNPKVRIIGVQSERTPAMKAALEQGKVVRLPPATTIADGIAVRAVGDLTLDVVRRYVDEIVTVSEGEIANAILLLLEIEKTVAEGAAAAPLAALVNKKIDLARRKVVVVISGGNIDVNLVSRIIEKGLVQQGRIARVSVILPDRPGALAEVAGKVGTGGANILEIQHVRSFGEVAIGETEVEMTLETRGWDHIENLIKALRQEGFRTRPV
jgi:threonine dehydratase